MDLAVQQLLIEMETMSRRIAQSELVVGPGGNLSVRHNGMMFITPSGYSFESVTRDEFVCIDIASGDRVYGDLKPSSEMQMHLACHRTRPDLRCVLHTHPPYSVAVGTTLGEIPPTMAEFPVHIPNLAYLGYITPTTKELADAVGERMAQTDTVFLKKHGVVVMGRTLQEVYDRTLIIEESARIYVYAKMVGQPQVLTPDELEDLRALTSPSRK